MTETSRRCTAVGVVESGYPLIHVFDSNGGVELVIGDVEDGPAITLSNEHAEHIARLLNEAATNNRMISRVTAAEPF